MHGTRFSRKIRVWPRDGQQDSNTTPIGGRAAQDAAFATKREADGPLRAHRFLRVRLMAAI